jgi:para-aminobenzoate synthetase / 4-amino-4-deoxychorismate lyase
MIKLTELLSNKNLAILDSNKSGEASKSFVFSGFEKFIVANDIDEVKTGFLAIENALNSGKYVVGYFSYELGYALWSKLSHLLPEARKIPLFCLGVYEAKHVVDTSELDAALEVVCEQTDSVVSNVRLNMNEEEYCRQLNAVKRNIIDGNTYQINYTLKLKFEHFGNALKTYKDLRQSQKVEYGAFLDFPDLKVISRSPELFVSVSNDTVVTKPMKGTIKRGTNLEDDAKNKIFLTEDEKSRAENVMIVDLLRNDLSRICLPGSVKVPKLFHVDTYETLHQMISVVTAKISNTLKLTDFIKEIFPCGSITGAPKIRTMQLINELEYEPRGLYTGGIGFLSPDRSMTLNVAIRTLAIFNDGNAEMGVGSGVVYDSIPEREYEECALKAKFLTAAKVCNFNLIESLRWNGEYRYLDEHLNRLQKSANELNFFCDLQKIEESLLEHSKGLTSASKVRLELSRDGELKVSSDKLKFANSKDQVRVCLASSAMPSSILPFLKHKTTLRSYYAKFHGEAMESNCYDALLYNEFGEITEGTYNNVFFEFDNGWVTPSLDSGLLPGIERDKLIVQFSATVRKIFLHELKQAKKIVFCNSVRGAIEVTLVEEEECFA